jgi:signal transduction histidine kinase
VLQSQEHKIAEKTYFSEQFLQSQEQERTRIARELHDGISQNLSAIKYNIEKAALGRSAGKPATGDKTAADSDPLQNNVALLQGTVEEVRRIYMTLRPSTLDDLGLRATIGWFCNQVQVSQPHLRIEKLIDVQEQTIPEPLKITIYRVLQDAFVNIIAPREASVVYLWCVQAGQSLELTIKDDGINHHSGADRFNVNPTVSFGLMSLRERAAVSGGNLSLESAQNAGTTLRINWTLDKAA